MQVYRDAAGALVLAVTLALAVTIFKVKCVVTECHLFHSHLFVQRVAMISRAFYT